MRLLFTVQLLFQFAFVCQALFFIWLIFLVGITKNIRSQVLKYKRLLRKFVKFETQELMWTHNCQRLFTSWECPHHLLYVVQKFHSKTEMWTKLPFLVSLKGWICAPQKKTRHYHQPSLSLRTVHRNFWNAMHTFLEIGIQFRESNLVLGWRYTCVNAWPSHRHYILEFCQRQEVGPTWKK